MNTPTYSSEYILLFRGTNWDKGLSTEEIQRLLDQITAWLDNVNEQGKVKAGQPLLDGEKPFPAKAGEQLSMGLSLNPRKPSVVTFCCELTIWRKLSKSQKDIPLWNTG